MFRRQLKLYTSQSYVCYLVLESPSMFPVIKLVWSPCSRSTAVQALQLRATARDRGGGLYSYLSKECSGQYNGCCQGLFWPSLSKELGCLPGARGSESPLPVFLQPSCRVLAVLVHAGPRRAPQLGRPHSFAMPDAVQTKRSHAGSHRRRAQCRRARCRCLSRRCLER